jgi:hypothetical protein
MYIVNVHDISFDEDILIIFVKYDNNYISNVQTTYEGGELENLEVFDDASKNRTHP